MNVTIFAYVAYVLISVALTVWVGRTLHKNGRAFLIDVFADREDLADSVNHLLVVGFYLINFGYIALALKLTRHAQDATEALEAVSYKVGLVLVVLGLMHFFNLFVFSRIRASKRLADAPRPVPPDARLQPDGTLAAIDRTRPGPNPEANPEI
ncbi:MAG: hypothetical protein KAI24_19505 [Planctomycetes bacterium]|nr:hypothetical protein [Planctomycetota bacterium]